MNILFAILDLLCVIASITVLVRFIKGLYMPSHTTIILLMLSLILWFVLFVIINLAANLQPIGGN